MTEVPSESRPIVFGSDSPKASEPDKQVIVMHGDGSMGMNAMEMDTGICHKIPLLIVISLNGGWTSDPAREKPGRDLGYTRCDKMCEAFRGRGEYVTKPEDIRPALERAQAQVGEGMEALVNVRTDYRARYGGVWFSDYSTVGSL
jgi:thiamine pyrophosphate-dependent acetolactate synthase large subunit-like protein